MKKVARLRIPGSIEESTPMANTPTSTTPTNEPAVRTTGRIKKPKAVFDPSDNYLPRNQRISSSSAASQHSHGSNSATEKRSNSSSRNNAPSAASSSSESTSSSVLAAGELCYVCQKPEAKRGSYANKNKLLPCIECGKKIHKLCLGVNIEDFDILLQKYKCDNCRSCEICFESPEKDGDEMNVMITCCKCIKTYHIRCHEPKLTKWELHNQNDWKCHKCSDTYSSINGSSNNMPVKKIREIIGDETPTLSSTTSPKKAAVNNVIATTTAPTINKRKASMQYKTDTEILDVKRTKNLEAEQEQNEEDEGNNDQEIIKTTNLKNTKSDITEAKEKEIKCDPEKLAKVSNNLECASAASVESASVPVQSNNSESFPPVPNTSNTRYSPFEPFNDIPDVKQWSSDQVMEYFSKYFPNEAHVFKDQEIDGTSLLLLKRSDIIKKLPIKLGPSLLIYSLILKIQTQLNDPTLGWNCGL